MHDLTTRILILAAASLVALLSACFLAPSAVAATDRFVDNETGIDDADCSSSSSPCVSIGYARLQAGTGDTIKVDDSGSTYLTSIDLTTGISVAGADFVGGDEGQTIIDGGGTFAFRVPVGATAGTISGLTIRSTQTAVRLQGTTTAVTGNTFDSGGPNQIDIDIETGSPLIDQNDFTDSSTSVFDRGIVVDGASPTISGNDFTNQNVGITVGAEVAAPGVSITNNTMTGTHGSGGGNGFGISVQGGVGTLIQANVISAPDAVSTTFGIQAIAAGLTDSTSVTFRRNQIYGFDTGVFINDTSVATMSGDVVGGSTDAGLVNFNDDNPTGSGVVVGKNVTIVGHSPAAEAQPVGTSLTLDSSIIGDAGIVPVSGGTCTITRSRGPNTATGGGCDTFTTNAAPDFVNAVANNYRLTGSASNLANLIDDGDPAAPSGLDTVDFDGQKRAMDGDGNCTETRDIGADEFLPAAPTAAFTNGPANGSTINTSTASFSFTNSITCPGASFQCSLDGAAFGACASPVNLSGLGNGSHTFAVRALDLVPQSGAADTRTFTVSVPSPPISQPPAAIQPATKKKCKKAKKGAVIAKKCKRKRK